MIIPAPVINRYPLRELGHIPNIHTRLVSTGRSYFPSTIKLWNRLPVATISAPTFNSFKKLLLGPKPGKILYNTMCIGRAGIWLSRLRMGLSALAQHRFTYNMVEDASCPHCGQRETISHFFFQCPAYAAPRTELYQALTSLNPNININNKTQLLHTILHGQGTNLKELLEIIFEFLKKSGRFV